MFSRSARRAIGREISQQTGTALAPRVGMAAIIALGFLFAVASAGLMLKMAVGGWSLAVGMTVAAALAIAVGVIAGALVSARRAS